MKPQKLVDLPQSIVHHLPKTLEELEATLDVLAGLGLVTLYPDGTVGIAEEHLRQGVVDAAVAIVGGKS